jgi:hypothetical protein
MSRTAEHTITAISEACLVLLKAAGCPIQLSFAIRQKTAISFTEVGNRNAKLSGKRVKLPHSAAGNHNVKLPARNVITDIIRQHN